MATPESDESNQETIASSELRKPVVLPPVSPQIKKALQTTGRLPAVGFKYQMSDLLALALQNGASDLHLRVGEPPMFRVDGRMIRAEGPEVKSKEMFDLISAFTPEDVIRVVREAGQADFGVAFEKQRFRSNVFRAEGEWAAVLRRIPEDIPNLADIMAPPVFYAFTRLPRGLVLVTGPTGSGKTTTLAAMINQINLERPDIHILTLEDPIEFKHPRKQSVVTHRELGTDFVTFAAGLRAALREDPDVIMLGEMRDTETMEVAMMAAETGHLVFSTVHTVGAKDTVDRIITAFPPAYQNNIRAQLASILRGVISQVLLPHASGLGRVAAFEIMVGTPAIGNLIREDNAHQIPSFLQTQAKDGMRTLDHSLTELYADRLIQREVATEHAQDPQELTNLMRAIDEKRARR